MSKYTTELRYICETYAGYDESQDRLKVAEIIEKARPKLFDFDFPIYDEAYRSVLETKIIKHYYLREIGAETVGVFKLFLDRTLNEIMPYYNKMYESANLEYNPLYDVNYYREHEGTKNVDEDRNNQHSDTYAKGTTTSKTGYDTTEIDNERTLDTDTSRTGTDTVGVQDLTWKMYHDTPQGSLSTIDDSTYLTSAEKNTGTRTDQTTYNSHTLQDGTITDDGENKTTYNSQVVESGSDTNSGNVTEDNTINTTDEYITHIYGKSAYKSYPNLIKEYRETLINIDLLIINELNDCFMLLY